jgi:hypothetical protein
VSIAVLTEDILDLWALAACNEPWVDPEMFDPDGRSDGGEAAKTVCRECPIRHKCLEWAMQYEDHLVWGGMTPKERHALRRTNWRTS